MVNLINKVRERVKTLKAEARTFYDMNQRIRVVTGERNYTGKIISIHENYLILESLNWFNDTPSKSNINWTEIEKIVLID